MNRWPRRLFVVCASIVLAAGALAPTARAERVPVRAFTQSDGLTHDRVKRIVTDSRGFVWFCTPEGVSRFDGERFATFSQATGLPVASVNDIIELADGRYLIATNGGGVVWFAPARSLVGGAGAVRPFVTQAVGGDPATNRVNALLRLSDGRLLAGTDGGLFIRGVPPADDRFRPLGLGFAGVPEGSIHVWSLTQDTGGVVWIGTSVGLARLAADGTAVGLALWPDEPRDEVWGVDVEPNGRLWVAHAAGLVVLRPWGRGAADRRPIRVGSAVPIEQLAASQLPLREGEARGFRVASGGAARPVRALLRSRGGTLWLGTVSGGLVRVDPDGVQRFGRESGLTEDSILSLAEDAAGHVWAGTVATGVMRIARTGFTSFDEADGLSSARISSIFEDRRGRLHVVAGGMPVNSLEGSRFVATKPAGFDETGDLGSAFQQLTFQASDGEWWVPTTRGLYRFATTDEVARLAHQAPLRVYTERDGLSGTHVTRLFEDSHGDIWIGVAAVNGRSVNRWRRASGTVESFGLEQGLPLRAAPNVFFEDRRGAVWVGLRDGGFARWRNGRFTAFDRQTGLPDGAVRAILEDGAGRIWLTTDAGGLCRVDRPEEEVPRCRTFTTADGLSSNNTRALATDTKQRLYVGTERGVDRLDPETGLIRHFTTSDGLARNEIEVAFRARDGALWFGTLLGLSRYVPEPEAPPVAPRVFISGIQASGQALRVPELGAERVDGLEFDAERNHLVIEFFGLGSQRAGRLRYEYRLSGSDVGWFPAQGRAVTYASLAPGTYRFDVRAVTPDGAASVTPATVQFLIRRPFWQRWWFLSAMALAVGGLAYGAHRVRMARLLDIEHIRMRIATDLHDDIGASLSQISILSEVARREVGPDDPLAADRLESIASASRDLVDAMSDVVWAINPKRDSLADLVHRMRRFANDALTPRDMALIFSEPPDDPQLRLGAEARREVYLVLKEAINNCARHSGATIVTVDVGADRHELRLCVSDNGRGFDVASARQGNGLASLQRRADHLGGTLTITSEAGRGTTIDLSVPLGPHRGRIPYLFR